MNLRGRPFEAVHFAECAAGCQRYYRSSLSDGSFDNGSTQNAGGDAMEVDEYAQACTFRK